MVISFVMTLWSGVGSNFVRVVTLRPKMTSRAGKIATVTHTYRVMDDQIRPIKGYPAYRVSRDGEVQSCWSRTVEKTLTETWHPLKPVLRRGYRTVNLSDGTRKRQRYIHRLVLETFVGPAPEGMVCRHLDGDRTNNTLGNLTWGTFAQNEHDKIRHGTKLVGEQINAKLTEAEVMEIRRLRVEGMTFSGLADAYGVSRHNVKAIVYRRSWRHLP